MDKFNIAAIFEALYFTPEHEDHDDITFYLDTIMLAKKAQRRAYDTLVALYRRGPLEDGDVPSKSERDWLVQYDLAAKIINKGKDGNQALTYYGRDVLKVIDASANLQELTMEDLVSRINRTSGNQSYVYPTNSQ
tara:strand:- start:43 stop:447 length:405 start_codon:yes stop_codon:yes gene_type:complete